MFKKGLFPFIQITTNLQLFEKEIISQISLFLKQAIESWLQFQFNPPETTEQIMQQILWLNSNILIDKKPLFFDRMFKKGIIFVNDIIGRTGGVMSHMQLIKTYGNVCSTQNYNQIIAALPQKWKRKVEGGESKELVCRPCIKEHNWLRKTVINKKVYQFHLRTKGLTAVPYRLQNSWEEIFDVQIKWHIVYELTRKTTPDFVKHHSTVEKYMANRNPIWMVLRDILHFTF